jgi:hypothetical protein
MRELKILMNTDNGQASFQTDFQEGELDGIIIDSVEKCEIIIESEMGYLLLHRHEHYGVKYYSVRNRVSTPDESLLDHLGYEEFSLNERLIITIRGRKNQEVKFTFRFSE